MNNNQNTANRVINICLLFVCLGAFIMLNSYFNKEKSAVTENNFHTVQVLAQKTATVQISTIVFPDFFKSWLEINSCNQHYISNIKNNELFAQLAFNNEFRFLSLKYLELKQIIFEDRFYYLVKNNKTDYSVFS